MNKRHAWVALWAGWVVLMAANGQVPDRGSGWDPQRTVMLVPDPDWDRAAGVAPGATVYAYVRNTSDQPMELTRLAWNRVEAETLAERSPHTAVWWRLNPASVPPGGIGELSLRLRSRPRSTARMEASFTNGQTVELHVRPAPPPFRIQSIAFSRDRSRVFLYVEREPAARSPLLPVSVLLDGAPVRVTWLSEGYAGGLRVGEVEFASPLQEGAWHTWTVRAADIGPSQAGATLRVISNPTAIGVAGNQDYARYAANGLNAVHSFHFQEAGSLDRAARAGVRVVMHLRLPPELPDGHADHAAVMGYNVWDEPDVADDFAGERLGRPWGERVGLTAMDRIRDIRDVAALAPRVPVYMTVNMTFMPANYYTYGPLADVTTTDFYPITHARPVSHIREAASHARRAAAPRPSGFIFQCGWEEFSIDISGPPWNGWAGSDAIRERGADAFRDPTRVRGFGRPPAAGEIDLQMAYLMGEGIKSFWGYTDATECCQGLLFHGAHDLPEVWAALTRMARVLGHVEREIAVGHPVDWAQADRPGMRVRTLVCGRDAALVVVTNENHRSDREGFSSVPLSGRIRFPDLPWLTAGRVERVEAEGPVELTPVRTVQGSVWVIENLETAAVYRVTAR